jgi:hypothetical protein
MTSIHAAKLTELAGRVQQIDAEVAALDTQYAELAGQFDAANNRAALQRAEQIEVKTSGLRRERALVNAACARIEELQKTELIEAEQEANRQRLAEARKHADAAMALAVRIDEAMRGLADLVAQRANALRALGSTGVIDAALINKLQSKGVIARAAAAAGLHRVLPLETPAPGSFTLLSASNTVLAIGRAAAAETSETNGDAGLERRRRLLKSSARNGGDRS